MKNQKNTSKIPILILFFTLFFNKSKSNILKKSFIFNNGNHSKILDSILSKYEN